MEDYLIRVLAKEAGVRGLACITTNLVQEAAQRHQTQPTATAALGRALSVAALLGALLKVQQRVAIKFEGDGPLAKMVVESDSYGRVRGYVSHPEVELPEKPHSLDFYNTGRAMGHGTLTVVKDLQLKDLYEGVVPLVTGEIDEDVEYYLNQSEQIPSAVQVGLVLGDNGEVLAAGGLLIQKLAGAQESAIYTVGERIQEMPPIEELLAAGQTPEEILTAVLGEISYEVLENRPLLFKCQCSWERSEQALMLLGQEELTHMLAEGQAVVECHFCHEKYVFEKEDIQMLLDLMNNSAAQKEE